MFRTTRTPKHRFSDTAFYLIGPLVATAENTGPVRMRCIRVGLIRVATLGARLGPPGSPRPRRRPHRGRSGNGHPQGHRAVTGATAAGGQVAGIGWSAAEAAASIASNGGRLARRVARRRPTPGHVRWVAAHQRSVSAAGGWAPTRSARSSASARRPSTGSPAGSAATRCGSDRRASSPPMARPWWSSSRRADGARPPRRRSTCGGSPPRAGRE